MGLGSKGGVMVGGWVGVFLDWVWRSCCCCCCCESWAPGYGLGGFFLLLGEGVVMGAGSWFNLQNLQ